MQNSLHPSERNERFACLVLAGFGYDCAHVSRALGAFLAELQRCWPLRFDAASGVPASASRLPWAERLYRWLDRIILGRNQWAGRAFVRDGQPLTREVLPGDELWIARDRTVAVGLRRPCVVFEFEGKPLTELAEAIRQRVGHKGAGLAFRILEVRDPQTTELLLEGSLRLDHRSLQRSIVRASHKAVDLVRAAMVRIGKGSGRTCPVPVQCGDGLPAWSLILRIPVLVTRWIFLDEQWTLLIARHAGSGREPPGAFRLLAPPRGVFWADPFLACIGSRRLLYFEELPFSTGRGHISVLELDEHGHPKGRARPVLKLDCHLSYPFVWQENGETFLVPESAERRQVTLYRLEDSGERCVPDCILIDGERLADASLVRWEGRYWMFACRAEPDAAMDDVLHVYWATDLRGPWVPHRLNPVKIDTRSSRPAGAPWVSGGQLFRPAQDCADTYGSAVRCMRISVLTPEKFEETEVEKWGSAMADRAEPWHTFNADEMFHVSDSLRPVPRWEAR